MSGAGGATAANQTTGAAATASSAANPTGNSRNGATSALIALDERLAHTREVSSGYIDQGKCIFNLIFTYLFS